MGDSAAPFEVVYTGAGFITHYKHPDVAKTLCGRQAEVDHPPSVDATCKTCLRRAATWEAGAL